MERDPKGTLYVFGSPMERRQMDILNKAVPAELMHFDTPSIFVVDVPEEWREDFELVTAYMMVPIFHMWNSGGADRYKVACSHTDMVRIDDMFDPEELTWTLHRKKRHADDEGGE